MKGDWEALQILQQALYSPWQPDALISSKISTGVCCELKMIPPPPHPLLLELYLLMAKGYFVL